MSRPSIPRIIQVTIGLSLVGAAVGAILGTSMAALLGLGAKDFRFVREVVLMGGVFGAAMGAVLAPLAAWTLMRRVPIWRAIAETAVGTVLGTGLGFVLRQSPPLVGLAGFAVAAIRLRLSTPRELAGLQREDR